MNTSTKKSIRKCILIGDSGVGKSSLLNSYFKKPCTDHLTIGVEFKMKKIGNVTIQFWDTAGQERFRSIVSHYYRDMDICIAVYDGSDYLTFTSIEQQWISHVKNILGNDLFEKIPIVLVENKSDKTSKIPSREIFELLDKYKNILHFEKTSALTKTKVDGLFEKIIEMVGNVEEKKDKNTINIESGKRNYDNFPNYDKLKNFPNYDKCSRCNY